MTINDFNNIYNWVFIIIDEWLIETKLEVRLAMLKWFPVIYGHFRNYVACDMWNI